MIHFRHYSAGLRPFASFAPEPVETHRGPEFERFSFDLVGSLNRSHEGMLGLVDIFTFAESAAVRDGDRELRAQRIRAIERFLCRIQRLFRIAKHPEHQRKCRGGGYSGIIGREDF